MNSEADVAVITAQQKSLLEALPCYVFVQRGGNVVYAAAPFANLAPETP